MRAARGSLPALPPAETAMPTPPTLSLPEDTTPSETLRVLQAVERGELSIDEAMERLATIEE